ncbi:hypothetical protein CFP56_022417 [Quercus suber]|uniref:Uncharacterized protein n=1 Tax=Quercus suber TaxID=58331 RepID=A0AAW0KD81_QUESU
MILVAIMAELMEEYTVLLARVLEHASLFEAATDMGKCVVAIVEDLLAPKIINILLPFLFALRVVSNSAINSDSAAKWVKI